MHYREARFPENISYGSKGSIEFRTTIFGLNHGREQRRVDWEHPRRKYTVAYRAKSYTQLALMISFFYAHKGRSLPFRFKDWSDYKSENEKVSIGNGEQLNFQLIKNYKIGTYSYDRIISKPMIDTVEIYLDSAKLEHDKYEVSPNDGQIKFHEPPGHGVLVSASFEFDVLVRFDIDSLSYSLISHGNYECSDLILVEVK